MLTNIFDDVLWVLHYDGEGDDPPADPPANDPPADDKKKGKFYTQAELDKFITDRTNQARRQSKNALEQLESLQENFRGSEEQRTALQEQVDTLRKSVLTAEEIRKREEAKAKTAYEKALDTKTKEAQTWESRYRDVKIKTDVTGAAAKHGVLPQAIDMVIAVLKPNMKMTQVSDDAGNFVDFTTLVDFNDVGADGKSIQNQLPIEDTIKRMKELPEMYGHLFAAPNGGGVGGNNGRPSPQGKQGFRQGMSQEDYMKLRKENPSAIYGS